MASRLLSRAEIGLRPWTCFPTNMRVEAITVHYPGPSPWTTGRSVGGRGIDRMSPARFRDTCDHAYCPAIWRGYQAFHMDARAGCDIFYHGACCPHGVRLAGRPKTMRSGAQGTDTGNYRSVGIQYIGGVTAGGVLDPLTVEAKTAFRDWAVDLGWPLRWGHRDWKPTDCPGSSVYAWRQAGFPLAPSQEDDMTPQETLDIVRGETLRLAHFLSTGQTNQGINSTTAPWVTSAVTLPRLLAAVGQVDDDVVDSLAASLAPAIADKLAGLLHVDVDPAMVAEAVKTALRQGTG